MNLEFMWRGGRLSLNFVATVGKWRTEAFERLPEPGDLARWFRDAGMINSLIPADAAELTDARQLRAALWRILSAGPSAADVAVVDRWASMPLAGPHLDLVDGRILLRPTLSRVDDLLGLVARDAAELLGGPLASRVRECAGQDCTLLFLDESRGGSRRWCSMDGCGARSKMSNYRKRLTSPAETITENSREQPCG